MKKLLICICILVMAFMFISCNTSPKFTQSTNKEKHLLVDLNGKWKVSCNWSNEYGSDTFIFDSEIVQKGAKIKIINKSNESGGTIKNNTVYLVSETHYNLNTGVRTQLPSRQFKISQDGNTMTSNFDYIWDSDKDSGNGTMDVTMTRK